MPPGMTWCPPKGWRVSIQNETKIGPGVYRVDYVVEAPTRRASIAGVFARYEYFSRVVYHPRGR